MPHYHRKENRIQTNTMPAAESVCVRKSYIKMNIPPPPPKLPKSRHILVWRIKCDNSEDIYVYEQLKRVVAVEIEGFSYELH